MKFSDFVVAEAVIPELSATDRNAVIRELVSALATAGRLSAEESAEISKAVIQRENQGSTGFGKGVAVPHAKHPKVETVIAAIGRSSAGVDFSALDRAPVYTVILLLSPPTQVKTEASGGAHRPDPHLQAMENIFTHLQRENFRRFLRQATTREAILDLLHEADEMRDNG